MPEAHFQKASNVLSHPADAETRITRFQGYKWKDVDTYPWPALRQRHYHIANNVVNWDSLVVIAENARNQVSKCQLNPKIGWGGQHMIREVCFDDGISWIAKLPMGPISCHDTGHYKFDPDFWTDQQAREMQIEADTMNFLATHSSIPVPRVHAAQTSCQNPVHLPYMLMDAVRGNSVKDMGQEVPAQYMKKYLSSLAEIHVHTPVHQ